MHIRKETCIMQYKKKLINHFAFINYTFLLSHASFLYFCDLIHKQMILGIGNKEEALAKRLRNGSNTAMREFYSLYSGSLTAACARYIINEEDTKDVMQESMIKIFSRIGDFKYRGKGSLQAWATRLVINQALSFLRDKKRQEWIQLEWDLPDEPEVEDPPIDNITAEELQRMIQELPTGYRTVFNLFVLENKSHDDISRILGIKKDSSASQLHRAKNLLAKKISEYRNNKNIKYERSVDK